MVVRQTIFDPASWLALKHTLRHDPYVSGRPGRCPRVAVSASKNFSGASIPSEGTGCSALALIRAVPMNAVSVATTKSEGLDNRVDKLGCRMSISNFFHG